MKGTIPNKSAAGLRRSAIAERLRLREEWSSLKGTDDESEPPAKVKKKQTKILSKKLHNTKKSYNLATWSKQNKENSEPHSQDALRGVVALVDVGSESRGLPLRAALSALGASVVSAWSPLVTHLIWSQGGCRDTRARARALACRVVSPLWVEACAASSRRISEKVFPSTSRDSDLPSPATLCRLLKTAEKENWQLPNLQSDSEDDGGQIRLRISSDLEEESTDEANKHHAKNDSVDIEARVNTAPRRALPVSISPPPANPKSRRKLFTARADGDDDSDPEETPALTRKTATQPEKTRRPDTERPGKSRVPAVRAPERQKKIKKYNLTQEQKKNLENARRMARELAVDPAKNRREEGTHQRKEVGTQQRRTSNVPRIVLSGMPMSQYRAVFAAIQTLKGLVQRNVDHTTTHVLLGTCEKDEENPIHSKQQKPTNKNTPIQNKSPTNQPVRPFSICNQCNSPESLVMRMFECDNVEVIDHCSNPNVCDKDVIIICRTVNKNPDVIDDDVICVDTSDLCNGLKNDKRLRTLKTLLGAVRGCRVLHAQWALDSLKEGKWLCHLGYELSYLLKIAQKARIQRLAIGKMHSKYSFKLFRGMSVCVKETALHRDPAIQLLSLCGAELVSEADLELNSQFNAVTLNKTTQNGLHTQNGALTQNGRRTQNGGYTQYGIINDNKSETVVVGNGDEEVTSKWVFDSVVAGRPRTTRRYLNKNIIDVQG